MFFVFRVLMSLDNPNETEHVLETNKGQVDHVGTSFVTQAPGFFFFFDKQSHNGCGARSSRPVPLSVGHSNVLTTSWHLVKNPTVEKKNRPATQLSTSPYSILRCPAPVHDMTSAPSDDPSMLCSYPQH